MKFTFQICVGTLHSVCTLSQCLVGVYVKCIRTLTCVCLLCSAELDTRGFVNVTERIGFRPHSKQVFEPHHNGRELHCRAVHPRTGQVMDQYAILNIEGQSYHRVEWTTTTLSGVSYTLVLLD